HISVPVTTTANEPIRSVQVQRANRAHTEPERGPCVTSNRFDRFLPLAGVLAGLLLLAGLVLLRDDPSSETGPAETFSYWQADHGKHQIIGLILAPLIAFLLVFFGAGLKRRLGDDTHGSVAFGGALLAAGTFVVVGMLEAAMT